MSNVGIKSLAKDTAIYGMSSILGKLLNWLLVPLYTRVLPNTGEFGVVTNIYAWTALLLAVLTYGMETGFFRFVNKKDEQEPMRVYASTLYSIAITSTLFIFLCLLFLDPISSRLGYGSHPEYLGMMACIVGVDAFCCIPFAFLRHQGKAIRFAALKFLSIFLSIFLNIFFLVLCPKIRHTHPELVDWFYRPGYGVGYIFIANTFTTAITFILLIPDMLPGLRARFDFERLKKMLRYSAPILVLSIAGVLNQSIDKIMFPYLFEDKAYADSLLGIYGACFKIAVIMAMFTQAFRFAYEPFVFAKNRDGDHKQSYVAAMKYFIIFSFVIFIGVMYYIDIIKHFVDAKYYAGLGVVPIVMLGELFFGVYFNLSIWYKLTDKTFWGAIFSITGCVLTVVIIFLYVPVYGYIACAWACFASNLLMMALSYFVGRKKYPVDYDLRSALFYSVLAAGFYFAGMLPQMNAPVWQLTYRSGLLLLFVGIIYWREVRK